MLAEIEKIQWRKRAGLWAFAICLVILTFTGILARITLNLQGASVANADLAIFGLLSEETINHIQLLRDEGTTRHYLLETAEGNKLAVLQNINGWKVLKTEDLR